MMVHRILLGSTFVAMALSLGFAGDTVTGGNPRQHIPLTQAEIDRQLKDLKTSRHTAKDLMQSNARMHGMNVVSTVSQPPPRSATVSGPRGTTVAAPVRTPAVAAPVIGGPRSVVETGRGTPAPAKAFVYEKPFTDIKIQVEDQGYGLDAADQEQFRALFAHLPVEHVRGIKRIVIRPRKDGQSEIESNNGTLYVAMDKGPAGDKEWPKAWFQLHALSRGIGEHVYQNVMSAAQRSEWQQVATLNGQMQSAAEAQSAFGFDYSSFVSSSKNSLISWAGDPARELRYLSAQVSVNGVPVEPTKPAGPPPMYETLPRGLVVASVFATNNGLLRTYAISNDGTVSSEYAIARRTPTSLTLGKYEYRLNGKNQVDGLVVVANNVGYSSGFRPFDLPEASLKLITLR